MRSLLGCILILLFAFGCGKKATNESEQPGPSPETPNTNPNGKPGPQAPSTPAGLPAPTGNTYTNDFGMEFVRVPKGTLWNSQIGQAIPDDFYIGVYEVTQEEWQKLRKRNPSNFSELSHAAIYQPEVKIIPKDDFKRFPVEKVSWKEAGLFVSDLNSRLKIDGWQYRLPTQVQWEYAARGAEQNKEKAQMSYHFKSGPTNTLTVQQANFGNLELLRQPNLPGCLKRTCKVGSYEPNELGIYDMHGNVWEWTADYYPGSTNDVIRCGGAFSTNAQDCSAGNRGRAMTYYQQRDVESSDTGLRIVIVPSVKVPPPVVKPNPNPKPSEPQISKVTASGFMNLLKADKQAATRYKQKPFQIEGTIAEVDTEHRIVTLTGTKTANVMCFFIGADQPDFAQFKVGQKVTVKGIFTGTDASGHAQVLKCEVVK